MINESYKRKLIEVALPLDAINAASQHENQPFTRGHPRSLHLWWARRPLAACKAIIFAQLVDDPSEHPERFPTAADQSEERQRLFDIIGDLVRWENSSNEEVLDAARKEIVNSNPGEVVTVVDPFAGGARIPLAAQQLGLRSEASDLNPVAVLINQCLLSLPPRWSGCAPIHSSADNRTEWVGVEGLAEDLRQYARGVRDEAHRRIGSYYPAAVLPDGSTAPVIAWIWARSVRCPNPACGATAPLSRTFWLTKKRGRERWIQPRVDEGTVRFEIADDPKGPELDGTVNRRGAVCLVCSVPFDLKYIRAEGQAGRLGEVPMAVVAEADRGKTYVEVRPGSDPGLDSIELNESYVPSQDFPEKALGFRIQAYGMTRHRDLYSKRQLLALTTLVEIVRGVSDKVYSDAITAGMSPDEAREYGRTVSAFLAMSVSRWVDLANRIASWNTKNESIRALFARQAVPMAWDYAEANPLSTSVSFLAIFENALDSFALLGSGHPAGVSQADAAEVGAKGVVVTDPPYYDNIGYADLSDIFYVWLRPMLELEFPDLFRTLLTPKSEELIASRFRHGSEAKGAEFFEDGFVRTFSHLYETASDVAPMTVFYAFKQASGGAGDEGDTGWSTMLEGLATAGWSVTATWPIRTERSERSVGIGTNALASSVVLACRRRPNTAGVTDRRGLIRALHEHLPGPLRELQKSHIAPVDLRQAAIGPGMAVFSGFARVIEQDGEKMRVRTALTLINQVLDQVLGEQEQEFDSETRWAINWFSQFFLDEGPYGTAEQLAVSMNVAVSDLVEAGVLEARGGKARLLSREELPTNWDPVVDLKTPVWEATQHLVKRLETEGETSAARLLGRMGGLGESAQLLAYRLYTVCERTRPNLAGPYNALVTSWPEIQRLAREASEPFEETEQQSFEV